MDPGTKTLHQLFEEQVARSPDAVAVVHGDRRLTYRELNRRANKLAHHLIELGIVTDTLVGVCLERSFDMVTALVAILKAGGAYLPLDPAYPNERLAFMLDDARVPVVLTHERLAKSLPASGARAIFMDQASPPYANESESNPTPRGQPEDLAYVTYTSGSTGRPKGVAIPQRGVVGLVFGVDYVRFDSTRAFLQLASISFDVLTFDVWGTLLHGGRCVLFEDKLPTLTKLRRALDKHRVTTLFLTTPFFNTIVDEDATVLAPLEELIVGGEALSVAHVRKALRELPDVRISNIYGPTEITTFATHHPVRELAPDASSIPIGRAIGKTELHVLDADLRPVPAGGVGELCIGGPGVARGYLNRPELTQERFITSLPFLPAGTRLYRTGDLVRCLSDGTLDFVGRVDSQVKVRGFRIELGEIEAHLVAHSSVRQAAVVVRETERADKNLVAYLVGDQTRTEIKELRSYLQQKLPSYMVPSSFEWLDALPLTPNGKVNRKDLANR